MKSQSANMLVSGREKIRSLKLENTNGLVDEFEEVDLKKETPITPIQNNNNNENELSLQIDPTIQIDGHYQRINSYLDHSLSQPTILPPTVYYSIPSQEMSQIESKIQRAEILAQLIRKSDLIQNRTFHLQKYPQCFVGSQLVDWMVELKIAQTRQEARILGQELMNAHFIHHVTCEHAFEDQYFFYRFFDDDPLEFLLLEANKFWRRPYWKNDSQTQQCYSCSSVFGISRRKHHCRNCGNVVCSPCCDEKLPLYHLGYNSPVRVCKLCYALFPKNKLSLKSNSLSDTMKRFSSDPDLFSSSQRERDSYSSAVDSDGVGSSSPTLSLSRESTFFRERDENEDLKNFFDKDVRDCENYSTSQFLFLLSSTFPNLRADDIEMYLSEELNKLNKFIESSQSPLSAKFFSIQKLSYYSEILEPEVILKTISSVNDAIIINIEQDYLKRKTLLQDMVAMISSHNESRIKEEKSQECIVEVDVTILLNYLRSKKYDSKKAFKRLLKFEQFCSKNNWLTSSPIPKFNCVNILNSVDVEGRNILHFQIGLIDLEAQPIEVWQISAFRTICSLLQTSTVQIKGITVVVDLKQIKKSILRLLTREHLRQTFDIFQGRIPLRVAQILVINHKRVLVDLIRPFLTTKINQRILFLDKIEQLKTFLDSKDSQNSIAESLWN